MVMTEWGNSDTSSPRLKTSTSFHSGYRPPLWCTRVDCFIAGSIHSTQYTLIFLNPASLFKSSAVNTMTCISARTIGAVGAKMTLPSQPGIIARPTASAASTLPNPYHTTPITWYSISPTIPARTNPPTLPTLSNISQRYTTVQKQARMQTRPTGSPLNVEKQMQQHQGRGTDQMVMGNRRKTLSPRRRWSFTLHHELLHFSSMHTDSQLLRGVPFRS